MASIPVESGVSGFVPDARRTGLWSRRRARAQAVREDALAESHEQLRIIEASGVIEKLVVLAQSRPGKYKIGISEAGVGGEMTVVMISGREYHLFPFRAEWDSVVVGVVRDEEGVLLDDLKVNASRVRHGTSDEDLMLGLKKAVDIPYPRVCELFDRREHRDEYRDEVRMKGRRKVPIPNQKRQ